MLENQSNIYLIFYSFSPKSDHCNHSAFQVKWQKLYPISEKKHAIKSCYPAIFYMFIYFLILPHKEVKMQGMQLLLEDGLPV